MTDKVLLPQRQTYPLSQITCRKRVICRREDLEATESEGRQGQHTDGDACADAVLLRVDDVRGS